ncbi:hypothetical protein GCM10010232_18220 [Streptomyces amakusaensis]|uniref:DUF397 domain-containing protein n=1 Tax=Streptomyces amakusaensis TaxID=67271 RepID=A0ABW0ASE2_9ACTN
MNRKDPNSTQWLKSTYSNGNGNCVEVCVAPRTVAMRDSKVTDGPAVTMDPSAWSSFVGAVKGGAFPQV